MSEFERTMKFEPAYDKRSPIPSQNYGIHGVTLRMALKGPLGAVSFTLYTNWQLPHVTEDQLERLATNKRDVSLFFLPSPADLGYHSPRKLYDWDADEPTFKSCEHLDGQPCWYDGSTLNAEPVFKRLVEEGSDGVWAALEAYYASTFMREMVG